MPNLGLVIASVRDGRVGQPIAQWVFDICSSEGSFTTSVIDLKAVGLPLLSEPEHPRLRKYTQSATLAWSELVSRMDAFVFVTPEYNHGVSPALVNALDHLYVEWNYKPAGFVSYGGVSAGTRSVAMAKSILNTLKIVPIVEAVNIPFFPNYIDKATGKFKGDEPLERAAQVMLRELARWTGALKVLRA
ncbi:MAG: NAD(P)H-dependent oxidoreductase [Acidimicrobiia bacterium]|nr:NAD(P)H-dependent oxidoreductase [Acidimicrobiia bacterium]